MPAPAITATKRTFPASTPIDVDHLQSDPRERHRFRDPKRRGYTIVCCANRTVCIWKTVGSKIRSTNKLDYTFHEFISGISFKQTLELRLSKIERGTCSADLAGQGCNWYSTCTESELRSHECLYSQSIGFVDIGTIKTLTKTGNNKNLKIRLSTAFYSGRVVAIVIHARVKIGKHCKIQRFDEPICSRVDVFENMQWLVFPGRDSRLTGV